MKKRIFSALLISALAVSALTACGGSSSAKKNGQTLTVLNYGKYIDESVVKQFEKETGITVKYEEYESPEDRVRRLRAVMEACQATLRSELGHPVQSFCWPWGVFCDQAREQAQAAGFTVFYTTRLGLNLPANPLAVNRIKVKSRTDSWLLRRLNVYSRPWLGFLYLALRL